MLLSVIIPCFNVGNLVLEAVESVLAQQGNEGTSLPDVEIIVVDDLSTDPATLAALEDLRSRPSVVRVLKNERRKGVSGARNQGIHASRGDWVAFLDADDVWTPDALRLRWCVVEREPEAAWVGGNYMLWYPDGRIEPSGCELAVNPRGRILAPAIAAGLPWKFARPVADLVAAMLVLIPSVMVRRNLIVGLGGFDETLSQVEDYEMWLRLALEADLYYVPQCTFLYRQRTGSLTNREFPPAEMEIVVFERLLKDPRFRSYARAIRRKLASYWLANAYYYRSRHDLAKAAGAAASVVRWRPFASMGWKQLLAVLLAR